MVLRIEGGRDDDALLSGGRANMMDFLDEACEGRPSTLMLFLAGSGVTCGLCWRTVEERTFNGERGGGEVG